MAIKSKNNNGQALISLMFFVIIAMFLISASVVIMIISSQSTGKLEGHEIALRVAEAGAEDALLKFLRDPSFTGETLNLPDGDASSVISGNVITVTAKAGNFNEKLEITTSFANNIMTVVSWREVY